VTGDLTRNVTDRPQLAAGTEIAGAPHGVTVRQARPPRVHQFNNTAAIVLPLCDGQHTVAEIAQALAGAFALQAPPLTEAAACVAELRRAGVLAGPRHPATARIAGGPPAADRKPGSRSRAEQADNPFGFFEAIYCLNLDHQPDRWAGALRRFTALGIAARVERFPAIAAPHNPHAGCARSWRLMVARARDRGLRNFLGIEDDAIFLDQTLEILRSAESELAGLPWDLLYLGGCPWHPPAEIPGHLALQSPSGLTCTHALAVNSTAYDRLLAGIPAGDGIEEWITRHVAIDQYLAGQVDAGHYRAYLLNPRVATQDELTYYADAPLRDRYTIR
jgi:Coenzyme PQQ synthesis protein D (PqqD)